MGHWEEIFPVREVRPWHRIPGSAQGVTGCDTQCSGLVSRWGSVTGWTQWIGVLFQPQRSVNSVSSQENSSSLNMPAVWEGSLHLL